MDIGLLSFIIHYYSKDSIKNSESKMAEIEFLRPF